LHGAKLVIAKLDRLSRDAHFLLGLEKPVSTSSPQTCQMPTGSPSESWRWSRRKNAARSASEKDALAAKARGIKLSGQRRKVIAVDAEGHKPYGEPISITAEARTAGRGARTARANSRAADLSRAIKLLQEAGATSLRSIAADLNQQGIPAARGQGIWTAVQVSRVLQRL
jgi:hypothetical protein